MIVIAILPILLTFGDCVNGEIYSSTAHIQKLLDFMRQTKISDLFKDVLDQHQSRHDIIKDILHLTKQIQYVLNMDDFNSHHPVDIFRFIRLCHELQRAKTALDNSQIPHTGIVQIKQYIEKLPTYKDLEGSGIGLMTLHRVYKLSAVDLINGKIANHSTKPLTTMEVLDLVNITMFSSHLVKTNMLNVSLHILQKLNETRHSRMSKQEVSHMLTLMVRIYFDLNCLCTPEFRKLRENLVTANFPLAQRILPNDNCEQEESCPFLSLEIPLHKLDDNYHKLCRNEPTELSEAAKEIITTPRQRSCRYVHNNNPGLRLLPFKVEVLNDKMPYMAIVHDIITDKEIETMKAYAREHLERGTVTTVKGQRPSDNKISQTTLLPAAFYFNNLPSFKRRLLGLTNLDFRGFELIQVANYGVGGFYNLHVDFLFSRVRQNFSDITNNRLVTITIYLNDVESGGTTVFPELGLRSQPKKGSALMFYNLFRNGTGNDLTRHASCPILYGEKWIANQWVLRNGQEFTYPCTTEFE